MWRELVGSGAAAGSGSENGKAVGGTREAALGVCALARGEEKVDGAEAVQEGADKGDGSPGEGLARSDRLLSRETGSVSPGARAEGLSVYDPPVSKEIWVGQTQHQTAKAFVPEWPGDETP